MLRMLGTRGQKVKGSAIRLALATGPKTADSQTRIPPLFDPIGAGPVKRTAVCVGTCCSIHAMDFKNITRRDWLLVCSSCVCGSSIALGQKAEPDFGTFEKIDAHLHIRSSGPEFLNQAVADRFKAIVIAVDSQPVPPQMEFIRKQQQLQPDAFRFVTTFPMTGWDQPDWTQKTIKLLETSFAEGAIGVKVWKNIGMDFRDKNGRFVLIDDPRFDPIFDYITREGKTLTAHIGEPKDCWLPLDRMVSESNRRYYGGHPQYHMYLHPEYPAYGDHIRAVERVLSRHPRLRYVGAHLASLEWSVEELARRLDRFPNLAVDLAARVDDLQLLDPRAVREFLIKYQDRVLYATDLEISEGQDPKAVCARLHARWTEDWKYFATPEETRIGSTEKRVRGLALPGAVLHKIYRTNAVKWYPGI